MDDLSRFCCLNSGCPDFGRRGAGNLTVTGRLGKQRQFRQLYCRGCRARFSERKGTPLYRSRLPEDKALSVLALVKGGTQTPAPGKNAPRSQGISSVARSQHERGISRKDAVNSSLRARTFHP